MQPQSQDSLAQLSRRFRPALLAFFLRRLGNHSEAEDLTQDVFARLMAMPSDRMDNPDAYIFQIAANLLRDRWRRDKVRKDYQWGVATSDGVGIETLDPARVQAGREALGQVSLVLRDLPERTRTIFILYRIESVKKRDIADGFGISISAVDKHLMKAMALLVSRLGGAT